MHKMPPPRPPKPRNGGRNSQRPTNQRVKRKSKSNLEKAGGYAYGAAKSITGVAKGITKAEIAGLKAVGGFLMPQRPAAKMMLKRMQKMPKDPKPTPQRKKKPPTKYYGYGNKPAPYGKKNLGAGVDTRPTERDSQIRKSQYGPPRTARDLELTKKPSRKMQPFQYERYLKEMPKPRKPKLKRKP